uniref:HTH araC/xylS-type domain-containing protein n=1 Tax=Steinernema glaseri TaxID=37863 RepID=A0A1I7YIK6_9BILA
MSTRLFTLDRNRFTSSGGTAPLDMMLHLISRDHGRELSAAISEMFVYERIRNEQDHQRVPLKHMLGTNQPKLQEIVALMEANLEEPIDLDELAVYVAVSRRQLERLFQKYLHSDADVDHRGGIGVRVRVHAALFQVLPGILRDTAA